MCHCQQLERLRVEADLDQQEVTEQRLQLRQLTPLEELRLLAQTLSCAGHLCRRLQQLRFGVGLRTF